MNENTYLSIEEIISLPSLSATNISEDGKRIAFVKKTANWKNNTYNNQIWIYEKEKEQCYPLTTNYIDSTHPKWSPDCRNIAYLSPVGIGENQKNQIFVRSIDRDVGVQITDEEEGISHFKWDPKGEGFYYVSQLKESDAIKKRKKFYGDYQLVDREYRNNCLFYIELENTRQYDKIGFKKTIVSQLTDAEEFHIHEFDISNNGEKVVFIATPSPNMEDLMKADLYIHDMISGELKKLNIDKWLGESVCFSPEGNRLCYIASIKERDYYETHIQDGTIEIYDLQNQKIIQPLTDFDSTVTPLRWTSKGILIRWQNKTNYLIGLLSLDGNIEILSELEDTFVMDASITRDGKHISYNKAKTNETFEIYFDDRKITNENSFFKGKKKSNRSVISWHSSDGLEIEGILSTPVEFDENKKYPLLVVVHGGPAWASYPIFSDCFNEKYPIEQFIEKGFIVLEPNYRGSSGYGNEFLKANYKKLGIAYYDDIISGVDKLVDMGIADNDRIGVMGWSNGGNISVFLFYIQY